MTLPLLLVLGLSVSPDPPQAGVPLQVQVPLGVGRAIDSATVRVARRAGIPVAEVLLVKGAGGVWSGVIDGSLVKPPKLGLWVKVRSANGRYSDVLGSADQPVWVDVAGTTTGTKAAGTQSGEFRVLDQIRRANEQPELGFVHLQPDPSLRQHLAREGGRQVTMGVDGRCRPIALGRSTDRLENIDLGLLAIADPWDGSLPCGLYFPAGSTLESGLEGITLSPTDGVRQLVVRGGSPSRLGLTAYDRIGKYRLGIQYLEDLAPSGLEIATDHSADLPSRVADRRLDDVSRLLLATVRVPGRAALGLFHESAGAYLGPFDTLGSGRGLRRRSAILTGFRLPLGALKSQFQGSYWLQDDLRELAGPGLHLMDADGDGQREYFDRGVLVSSRRHLLAHRWQLSYLPEARTWRLGGRLRSQGLLMLRSEWGSNLGIDGRALQGTASHPQFGGIGADFASPSTWDRAFHEGFIAAELLGVFQRAPWRFEGALGPSFSRWTDHPLAARLRVRRRQPGRRFEVDLFAQPQVRLLDRQFDPLGHIAQNLSEGMAYGAMLNRLFPGIHDEDLDGLKAPFREGLIARYALRQGRAVGLWRYRLQAGFHRILHAADGIDRTGDQHPYTDDGNVVEAWMLGTIDFAAWSGLRFHGSIWLGQSWASFIQAKNYGDPPSGDLVPLTDFPNWRWVNTIDQRILDRWSTGGSLAAVSPQHSSRRNKLTALHTFEIPAQVRIAAWLRYHHNAWSAALRFENAMSPYLLGPVPRPDRIPGLLPVEPRRVLLEIGWRPAGDRNEAIPFSSSF